MMTKKEVDVWCIKRLTKPHRLVHNEDNYAKYVWDNGDTYEFKIVSWTASHKESHIFINGELVCIIDK